MAPAGKVSRSHTPCAPAALGAEPGGRLPGLGTLKRAGCVVKAPTPKEGAVWRLATVPVSFSAAVSATSKSAPEGYADVSLVHSICAPVSAVAVLLFATKTFS